MKLTLDATILQQLREADGYLPKSELAALCGCSLTVIAERISELQRAGFEIAEHPHFGVSLTANSERLIADDLVSRLADAPWLRQILVFEETGSTNDVVAQIAMNGAAEGLAVFAERQTAGRGRLGRRWESAAQRGLWFSLLARPAFDFANWARLSTFAAVAVARGVEEAADCRAEIKWPNDVWIEGKKVAGILIESQLDRAGKPFAVIGIGVNVNHDAEDFPDELCERAVSLKMMSGAALARAEVAEAILREIAVSGFAGDFETILREAERRSCLLGRWVELRVGNQLVSGIAERLGEEGGLVLRGESGSLTTISSGEVTVVSQRASSDGG